MVHERSGRKSAAHHDFAQSANVFDLLGERYQAGLSQLALARLAVQAGTRQSAERYLDQAKGVFTALGAQRDLDEVENTRQMLDVAPKVVPVPAAADVDEAVVRRLVEAAILPELLARETATALLETTEADAAVVFVATPGRRSPGARQRRLRYHRRPRARAQRVAGRRRLRDRSR